MASGKAHRKASIYATPIVAIAACVATVLRAEDPVVVLAGTCAAGLGCFVSIIMNPDLDVDGLTKSEWNLLRSVLIVGVAWIAFWFPYAVAVPHRSRWSHLPVLGTLGRVSYAFGWFMILNAGLSWPVTVLVIVVGYFILSVMPLLVVASGVFFMVFVAEVSLLPMLTQVFVWFFIAGLVVGDTLHWVMDGLPL